MAATPLFERIAQAKAADAAVIAASSDAHLDLIRQAAAADKHILCEKPVAFASASIAALRRELRDYRRVVQVGFNRRFDPHFAKVRARLPALGRPYIYRIVNRDPKRPRAGFAARSGGMFCDFNSHDFDMLRFLSGGEIAEIYARAATLLEPAAAEIDTVVISAKMANGALALIDSCRETNRGYDQQIEILGANGVVGAANVPQSALIAADANGELRENPQPDFIARYRESFAAQLEAFIDAAQAADAANAAGAANAADAQPPVTLADAEAAIRAAEAAALSARENRPVAL